MFNTSGSEFQSTAIDPTARSVTVTLDSGRTIELSQTMEPRDLSPLFADEWTGSQVWNCSEALANHIELRISRNKIQLNGKSFIELGSGCGLVALCACMNGSNTVATDQEAMVRLIRRNAATNLHQEEEKQRFLASELKWACQEHLNSITNITGQQSFDIISVSDCLNPIYGESSYKALADTIIALSHEKTKLLLAYQHRSNGSKASQLLLDTFFSHLKGFYSVQYTKKSDDELDIYELERNY